MPKHIEEIIDEQIRKAAEVYEAALMRGELCS